MIRLAPLAPVHAAVCAAIHAGSYRPAWDASGFAALLAGPGAHGTLATEGAAPLGFVLARTVADESEVLMIAVLPEARRRGLGRRLLEAAMREAQARGAVRLFLEVAEDNATARALYAGAGFRESGRRRAYYRDGRDTPADALVLARALDAAPSPPGLR